MASITCGRRRVWLGMYALPELQDDRIRLWAAIAAGLAAAGVSGVPAEPECTDAPEALWRDPDLLLGECCGYPLLTLLAGRPAVVATTIHAVPGCRGTRHRSRLVVRLDHPARRLADCRGLRAVINDWHSNTGMNLLRHAVAPLAGGRPFFAAVTVTGSHAASLAAVAAGAADLAAVDCVTWALLDRHRPGLTRGLRTIGSTALSPQLPLISNADRATVAALRRVLRAVGRDPALAAIRRRLWIDRFAVLAPDAYGRVLALEAEAAARGYPRLM